jgi:hypothetical protein
VCKPSGIRERQNTNRHRELITFPITKARYALHCSSSHRALWDAPFFLPVACRFGSSGLILHRALGTPCGLSSPMRDHHVRLFRLLDVDEVHRCPLVVPLWKLVALVHVDNVSIFFVLRNSSEMLFVLEKVPCAPCDKN